jgi:O-antigen/teichoic acid export membrane protein
MIKLIGLNFILAAIGAILLLIFGDWIFSNWLGKSVAAAVAPLFPTLVFSYFLLSLSIVPFYYLNGIGNMRFTAMVCILGGLLALAIALFLIPLDGLLGLHTRVAPTLW